MRLVFRMRFRRLLSQDQSIIWAMSSLLIFSFLRRKTDNNISGAVYYNKGGRVVHKLIKGIKGPSHFHPAQKE